MSKKVLIVDDSKVVRVVIGKIVRENFPEYDILEAGDGPSALLVLEDHQIDYMTIDYNMPGMDGGELAEKAKVKQPNTKMTLVTANKQQANQERAENLGIGFVVKPDIQDPLKEFFGS